MTGWWLFYDTGCWQHRIFSVQSTTCAYYEGWSDFLPLLVNGDQCYDTGTGPCSGAADSDSGHFNLETHSRSDSLPKGDTTEGRIAGALYDFFDPVNDDTANFGFYPIASVAFHSPAVTTFLDYWTQWKITQPNDKHNAVKAVYLNSIEGDGYDSPPSISLPTIVVLKNRSWNHIVNLHEHSTDPESDPSQLEYLILNNSGQQCGVTLDSYWLNIVPPYNYTGQCNVTIRVSDGVKTGSTTFGVKVVTNAVNVPLVIK